MKVGDVLYMTPTLDTSSFMKEKNGHRRCWVADMNEAHRHFTVEFDFNGHSVRETYKMEAL